MKKETIFRPSILPIFTLVAGGIGLILRLVILKTLMEPGGLLVAGHPLSIILYILSACTLAVLALSVLPLKQMPHHYRRPFRKTTRSAFGCMFAAIGILVTCLMQVLRQQDVLTLLTMAMAFVTSLCFGLLGFARQKGSRPHYLVHAGIVIFLMLQLVSQYRIWSPKPQLDLYFFPLMATVFLMLSAYQALCLDIQKGDRRLYAFFNQAALFFCCLSLTDSQRYFYLGMGIFCATNLCSLRVSRSYYKNKAETPAQEAIPAEQTPENGEEA